MAEQSFDVVDAYVRAWPRAVCLFHRFKVQCVTFKGIYMNQTEKEGVSFTNENLDLHDHLEHNL